MYIWVILATFLAILASYSLAPRADYRQLAVEPLAEAAVARIVTKHQAARDYVRYRKFPYSSSRSTVDYNPGIIDEEALDTYIAFGHVNDADFVSQIFCMSEDMKVAYADRSACVRRNNKKMVVTYGAIPRRWVNRTTDLETPTQDFMNAMRNTVDSRTTFGYTADVIVSTERNISGSYMRVVNQDNDDYYVPLAVVNNSDFKRMCDLNAGKVCLVYESGI